MYFQTYIVEESDGSGLRMSKGSLFQVTTLDSNLAHNLLKSLNHLEVPKTVVLLGSPKRKGWFGPF